MAATPYVCFLDSDDEHLGDALVKLAAALDQNPNAVVAFGDAVKVTPTEIISNAMFSSKVDINTECEVLTQSRPRHRLRNPKDTMLEASLIPTCGSIFKRAQALEVGGMPVEFRTGEDWLFWLKLSERGEFIYLPEDIARVHRHAENLTHTKSGAETSLHKLAGFNALLDGSAGIRLNLGQRGRINSLIKKRISLLRYQSSRLGFTSYLKFLQNLPSTNGKSLSAHIVEDPKARYAHWFGL